jgi:GT2 family glycosyltransferase
MSAGGRAKAMSPSPGRPRVTIGVVQRERFSLTRESLESLYAATSVPFELMYVDAGSPRHVRRYLEAQASARGIQLIQRPHHVSPNCARNLVLARATTPYLVLVDNDVIFAPGWLDALLDCAEATGADVVTPLICIGRPVHTRIHVAGGQTTILEAGGARRLKEVQRFESTPLASVRGQLVREPTELAEFHCVFARRSLFDRIGPLDEALLSTSEHLDFSLTVRHAGGSIFFEPGALVTYQAPPPLAFTDLPYYTLRWSDAWNLASEQHFHRKWNLSFDDHVVRFGVTHRRLGFRRLRRVVRLGGRRLANKFSSWLDAFLISLAMRGVRDGDLRG